MPRILLLAMSVMIVAGACAGSPPEVPASSGGVSDPVLVVGRDVYGRSCKQCHGVTGDGGAGPRLYGGDFDEDFPTLIDLVDVISGGRKRMPPFSSTLSQEEITAVARYVREVL